MPKKSILKFLGTTIFIAWCASIITISIYYPGAINHMQGAVLYDIALLPAKLLEFPYVDFLWNTLTSFVGMAFFGFSCISIGMRVVNIFLPAEKNKTDDVHRQTGIYIPTYFLIGNAVFSLILLTIASLSQITPMLSTIVLGLGFLSGLGQFRRIFPLLSRPYDGQAKIINFLSMTILAVSLFQSSARISYDASAIYFSNAKLTALEQHAAYFMENTFVVSVFHSIIQLTAVIQIFGDQSARMITWLFGMINITIILAIASYIETSTLAKRILLTLILTSTAFLDLMGDGKVDLISLAYALGAIYWFISNGRGIKHLPSQYVLSGCFIGFACILRPYNTFLLGVFVFIYILQNFQAGNITIRDAFRQVVWLSLGAVGFAIYHFLINKILLGSPFAFWSNMVNIDPVDGPWDFKPETIWIQRFLYPIIVTFKNSPASLGSITPLVLIFLASLTIRDIRKRVSISPSLSRLALSAGVAVYIWIFLAFTIAEIRYVFFLWFILFIPIAEIGASAFHTDNALIRNVVKGSVILALGFILFRSAYISISKYAPLDNEGNPQCSGDILCGHLPSINKIADKGNRVLNLSAFRYYLRTDLFACSTQVEEYEKLRELSFTDSDAFWREVYRMGFSYVAFEKDYTIHHLLFSDAPFENLPDWVELTPIITSAQSLRITAYKFNGINSHLEVETICRQDKSGVWRLQSP